MLHNLGGEGLGRVVRAGSPRDGVSTTTRPPGRNTCVGPAGHAGSRRGTGEAVPVARIPRFHRTQRAVGILNEAAAPDRLGERRLGRRNRGGLVVLHPGQDRVRERIPHAA